MEWIKEHKLLSGIIALFVLATIANAIKTFGGEEATTTLAAPATTAVVTTVASTTAPTTTLASTATFPGDTGETAFVLYLRQASLDYPNDVTWVDVMSDDELLEMGGVICSLFEDMEMTSVLLGFKLALDEQFGDTVVAADYELAGTAVGAAVGALCPEYGSKIDG